MSDHRKTMTLPGTDPQHKPGPTMKIADPAPVSLSEPKRKAELVWHDVKDAPRDGRFVYFKGDPASEEWFWYQTRKFNAGVWEKIGWWRPRFGANKPPQFELTGYRLVSEGL